MKYNHILFVASLLAAVSCRTVPQGQVTVAPAASELMPDTFGRAELDVAFRIPEDYLARRSRLVVLPQLVVGDSVYAEYTPLVLDASVYRKKVERLEVLDGYVDPYRAEVRMVDSRKSFTVPYRLSVVCPDGEPEAQLRALLTTEGCGECGTADTLALATVSDPMSRFDDRMYLVGLKSDFVVRPKIREGKGQANLQFQINRSEIRPELGHNEEEMNKMLLALEPLLKDSLSVMDKLSVTGLASADGSLAFNTTLSRNRALAAKQWLVEQLDLPASVARKIQVDSRPEGWQPVLDAMRRASDPDAGAVEKVLERYADRNDDVQEAYIRRLPAWNKIKDRYLQNNRVVEYAYAYTVKSFTTDRELLDMYAKRPDAFSEEELLRVSALMAADAAKKDVYRTTLRFYPQSAVAANNLAVLLLDEENGTGEAVRVLERIAEPHLQPVLANTLAVAYHRAGRDREAMALLEKQAALPEARRNLGVLKALAGEYEEAYRLLKPFGGENAALLALRTGRKNEAELLMDELKK